MKDLILPIPTYYTDTCDVYRTTIRSFGKHFQEFINKRCSKSYAYMQETKLRNIIVHDNCLWKWLSQFNIIIGNPFDNRKAITFSRYNQCRISHNWRKGIYRDKVVLQHQENFMPWLQYYNSEALIISTGSELCCYLTDNKGLPNAKCLNWRIEVPTVQRNDVRTNDISRFVIKENLIICGNRDGSTAIYKLHGIKQRPKALHYVENCIDEGQVEVSAVELINSKSNPCIVTASSDSTSINYWWSGTERTDLDHFNSSSRLAGRVQLVVQNAWGVKSLCSNAKEDVLAIGLNGNNKPVLLDINMSKVLHRVDAFKYKKLAVRDIKWHNENTVVYVTHSGLLQFLDIRTGLVEYNAMDPFQSTFYCVKSDGDQAVLVGTSQYSRCVLFDTRNSSAHVQMYFTQKKSSPIYSLDFDSTKLIAAADRSVATLNFNVNVNSTRVRDYSHTFEFV